MKDKKKVVFLSIFTSLIFVGLAICIFLGVYVVNGKRSFVSGMKINGLDVSKKNVNQVVEELMDTYHEKEVSFVENEEDVLTVKLSSVGSVDQEVLTEAVQECLADQNKGIISHLVSKKNYEVEIPFTFDGELFQQTIADSNLMKERTASTDASLQYDGAVYYIEPEVYGTEFDEEKLQEFVKSELEAKLQKDSQGEKLEIILTSDLHKQPSVLQDNEELVTQMNVWNQYCQAKIEYVFGSETEVLDWNTIQGWITIENGSGVLNEEAVRSYVENLASNYNTIYRKRTITTSHGNEIELASNDYGYKVDYEGEVAQLLADIAANAPVEREPVYSKRGYSRNGKDDVNGTYIEIDLTNQHIWFYKDYQLIVESDIVTGKPSYQETTEGAFPLAYKASPFNLSGGGGNGVSSWDVEVQYWMPFHDGQGLHDASWRSSFGGDIYLTKGSHGCVNLPSNVAKTIYENVEAGMPIFLYK